MYTFDESIISDLHKDAYGFRPSSAWWVEWNSMSSDEKQETWERIERASDRAIEEELRRELEDY